MRTLVKSVALAIVLACVPGAAPPRAAQPLKFDVNDLSYLWPPASAPGEIGSLIAGDAGDEGGVSIWPEPIFKLLLETATSFSVDGSAGSFRISFAGFEEEFAKRSTWKVVSFRFDPAAPGGHASFVSRFGETPQLRIVLQPMTIVGGRVKVHDVTAHLAYSFVKPGPVAPAVPDEGAVRAIVKELDALRTTSNAGGASTAGDLRVHPGLQARVPGFAEKVRAFLLRGIALGQLTDLAFMGIEPPEPWIFFAMRRRPSDGAFVRVASEAVGRRDAQMLILRGGTPVVPQPTTSNTSPSGVSTAELFRPDAPDRLSTPVFAGAVRPLHQDIPDIIANPHLSHVLNTDCVSCHTESTRRSVLKVPAGDGQFRFQRPEGVSGVDRGHLPQERWNVRNFGWFQNRAGDVRPTISMRTANEAAEAADFVNSKYVGTAPPARTPAPAAKLESRSQTKVPKNVASPLTLVMNIKSPQDFAALKKKIEAIQGMPPEENPIVRALDKLATVHFARFVFLGERQLAVITTYDGSFEDYIDAFVNAIGPIFDSILEHVADAPATPVQRPENREGFLEFVRKHDLAGLPPFYSAYPSLRVLDILTLQKQHGGS